MKVRGCIPEIIRNDERLYEGNLVEYFRIVFRHAKNLTLPYHNFRHIFHVVWLCYQACQFYRDKLTPRQMRNLLIAAIFHDFDHVRHLGDDDINIQLAVRALERHVLTEDRGNLMEIRSLITATQYPYTVDTDRLTLMGQIIRDADLSQALSVAWIQQVIFGLAEEWRKTPVEVFKMQGPFMKSLNFYTEWARQEFPPAAIIQKIQETAELLDILGLEGGAAPPAPAMA